MHNVTRYTIHHVPFLRFLVPLVTGIVCQNFYNSNLTIIIGSCIAIAMGIIVWITRHKGMTSLHRIAFSLFSFSAMMCAGMTACLADSPQKELPEMSNSTIAIARIEERPSEKENTYSIQATIVALDDSTGKTISCHIPVLLNIYKSYTASTLKGGDLILFSPALQRIEPSPIPYSFDYAQYMARQGILYRQYLADETWQQSSYSHYPDIAQRAQGLQQRCISNLHKCGLPNENTALLSALLWGYKGDLPDTMREYFSAAGLSHILAVSGLHTGIIAFIIWLILYPLRYTRLRRLIPLFTIAVLWIYAFTIGLSPSVVRACIMATFIAIATLLNRLNTSLNALLGSAVIVLLLSPMQLFDIGFQLSYAAVAGILLLAPYFDICNYISNRHKLLQFVSGLLSVSIAAQLSTTLLAAYYFHYISLWGIISNIFLVPLLPLLVIATLLMQAAFAIGMPHDTLLTLVQALSDILIQGSVSIASLPSGIIDEVWVSLHTLLLYGILLATIWYTLSHKNLNALPAMLLITTILLISNIYQSLQPSNSIAILSHEQEYTTLQLSDNNHKCYIITTDSTGTIPHSGNEWRIKERLTPQVIAKNDTIATTHVYIAPPFVQYYDKRIVWIDDNIWRYCHSTHRLDIDYAIITESYNGNIDKLASTLNIHNIILASSLYPQRATRLQEECIKMGIACYNSHTSGVWLLQQQDN